MSTPSVTAALLSLKGLSHKELTEKYQAVLADIIKLNSSTERHESICNFVDALINESVGLVISRQLFADLCSSLDTISSDEAKLIANYALEKIQPRAISFEDQVTSYRQFLAAMYEKDGDWKRAASMLSGIPLETSQK